MKLAVHGREAYAYTGGKPFAPSLPCVVLVHGAMNDHSVWALQSRWLAHHGRAVLAVDLPGHGRSTGPAPASIEDAADWLLALLQAAGVKSAALAGHSMGSLIALEAAARSVAGSSRGAADPTHSAAEPAPLATGLLMIATAFPMKVSPALLEAALRAPADAIDQVTAFSHSTLAAKPSNPGPGTWLRGAARALMHRLQTRYAQDGHGNLFQHDFGLCNRYAGGLQAAAQVRCPARLLLGEHDAMTSPKATAALAEALRAPVRRLPAGHALMAEVPDAVLNELQDFVPPGTST